MSENVAAAIWDSRAEYDVGVTIERYLRENPPPPQSRFAKDFADWSESLRRNGEESLSDWGARRRRVARGRGA